MSADVRRAVVTGLGVVSPIGRGRAAFTEAVMEARSGLVPIQAFDTSPFRSPFGGEIQDFEPLESMSPRELELFSDRYIQLAAAAAREALADAGLSWSAEAPPSKRVGLVVGTCNGGLRTAEDQYRIILKKKPGRFDRRMNLLIRYPTLGKALSYLFGISGPTWIITTACSSSTTALAAALELISQDVVDAVLAGGTDALCIAALAGFDTLKATSTGKTAPFSIPPGLNLGEGAAFWVVEDLERARSRGARIEAEILGYALTADAHHPTAPDPRGDGAYRTMAGAVRRAGIAVRELGCINAHGTGTEANDLAETKAVSKLVGDESIPVYSFKSQVGHCLGAAGILEASAGLVAMLNNTIPATINFTEPRPGCNLDYVPNNPRHAKYDHFLSCNYAFGGNNAGVVIGRHISERGPASAPNPDVRTVLTGSGAISSLGFGADAILDAMLAGRRGLVSCEGRKGGPVKASLAGLVPEFTARDLDRRLDFKGMNRISRYAAGASYLALKDTGLRVGPKEGLDTGVINGVYTGPDEEDQMISVISSGGAESNISVFSQVVASATAGWISSALLLKGYSTTVSQGPDAGLFAMLMAHLAVKSGSAVRVLAGAADEVFPRYLSNYNELGFLWDGGDEERWGLRFDKADRRVLGEGAAYVVVESDEQARARGAKILAELVGFGMATDCASFFDPNLQPGGLGSAIRDALDGAGWGAGDVGLVTWSPQGNSNDRKILDGLEDALGSRAKTVPILTSVFHTGLSEAASGVVTLAALLKAWSRKEPPWRQITGLKDIDERELPQSPVPTLAIGSSDLGYNLALAVSPAMEIDP